MKVEIALNGGQVDHASSAQPGHVVGLHLIHGLTGALYHARNTAFPHKHMVRLLSEHELGGASQRVETAFGEGT